MLIRVLGSAAGGGFPQWNCGCPNCRSVRAGESGATARTQESRGRQRRRRSMVPAELLAGDPPADRELSPASSSRPPSLADHRDPADERRSGSLPGPPVPARIASARGLRDRPHSPWIHGGQRAVPDARSLSRPGHLALAPARQRGGAGRPRWPARRGLLVEAVAVPGKLPIHLEAGATPDPEDSIGFRIRERVDRAGPGLPVGGRRGDRRGPPRARDRRLRVLRRDLLVGRRASRARARHEARGGHGARAGGRSGREPRPL